MLPNTLVRLNMMALALIVVSACTFTPHDVQLRPTAQAAASDIGRGTHVYFRFIDERDDVTVGHRGVATVGAKISANDLAPVVEGRLRDGLRAKQFEITDVEQSADAEVTYRLRSFKFDIETGFWTGGQNAAAALAVDAKRRDHSYANVYRFNSEERILAVPGGDEIDEQMNAVLDQVLQKALSDDALCKVLAGQ